ncbi:small-conductance mechanosensitive ion channel [Spirochaetia bacterium]|nr:small-conductance mechanosensitive ion channel [Spirochaetia bacterium]
MDDIFGIVFLNNSVKQWLISAACILAGFIAGKVCSLIMRAVHRHIAGKTKSDLDDIIIAVLERPLGIIVFLAGITLGVKGLQVHEVLDLWAGRILNSIFIALIAWGIGRVFDNLILRYVPHRGISPLAKNETEIQPLLRKFLNVLIWIIAGALILRTLGYNVSGLLAGLGLGGAALALASKDTLSNFFGSITVFVDRPFRINDRIKIGAYDGTITEMGIRTSRLRTLENRTVFIPNSLFAVSPIENISAAPNTRVVQTLLVKGDNGPDKIERGILILKEICSTLPGLVSSTGLRSGEGSPPEASPQAVLAAIGGVNCQISLTYYVSRQADYAETVSRINLEILRRFAEAAIALG